MESGCGMGLWSPLRAPHVGCGWPAGFTSNFTHGLLSAFSYSRALERKTSVPCLLLAMGPVPRHVGLSFSEQENKRQPQTEVPFFL